MADTGSIPAMATVEDNMIIIGQNRDCIYNFDNMQYIRVGSCYIVCKRQGDGEKIMAQYGTEERALDVFNEICNAIRNANCCIELPKG